MRWCASPHKKENQIIKADDDLIMDDGDEDFDAEDFLTGPIQPQALSGATLGSHCAPLCHVAGKRGKKETGGGK